MAGRRLLALLGALAVLLGAAAGLDLLPRGRELEELALIRALGVDAGGDGVAVTAASGAQREQGVRVYRAGRATVSGACLALQAQGEGYVFHGHTSSLLLGEGQARRDARAPLEYVLRDVELRLSTDLYLVRDGAAGEVLLGGEREEDSVRRLETISRDMELMANSMTRTVGDTLTGLSRDGAALVPAVVRGEGGTISAAGYGVLKGDRLAGWMDGEAAYGANLALGRAEADIVALPWGERPAALRVVKARTRVRPVFENGKLERLLLICKVEADLAEGTADLNDPAQRAGVERGLAEVERARLEGALAVSRALDADCLELAARAALADPLRSGAVMEGFSAGNTPVEVRVEAAVGRSYDVDA